MADERSSQELRSRLAFLALPGAARIDGIALAIVAVACLAALVNAHVFATTEVDDAYITFRYADNLARGLGPTYNPGEHVEGTSSFLFMLVLALPVRLGINALAMARVLGTAAFAGTVVLAYVTAASLARRWPRVLGAGAAVVVSASTSLAFHANTGLETDVFAFLSMLAFSLLVCDVARARQRDETERARRRDEPERARQRGEPERTRSRAPKAPSCSRCSSDSRPRGRSPAGPRERPSRTFFARRPRPAACSGRC
jgi:hypothetical protein